MAFREKGEASFMTGDANMLVPSAVMHLDDRGGRGYRSASFSPEVRAMKVIPSLLPHFNPGSGALFC